MNDCSHFDNFLSFTKFIINNSYEWRFNISGTLSSNLPDSMTGSWDLFKISGSLPSVVDQGGTMVLQQVVVAGGCNDKSATDDSCAEQSSFVLNTATRGEISPDACPAPRFSPVLIPNLNTFSTSFSSQVFLLLGTFNSSLWQDSGGLNDGEVVCSLQFASDALRTKLCRFI